MASSEILKVGLCGPSRSRTGTNNLTEAESPTDVDVVWVAEDGGADERPPLLERAIPVVGSDVITMIPQQTWLRRMKDICSFTLLLLTTINLINYMKRFTVAG